MTHSKIIAFEPRNPVVAYDGEDGEDDEGVLEELAEALASMPRGLCMLDEDARLIFCNAAFAVIYGLPSRLTRPGTTRAEIIDFCITSFGAPMLDVRDHLALSLQAGPDETVVGDYWLSRHRRVRVAHTQIAGGGYLATHEELGVAAFLIEEDEE